MRAQNGYHHRTELNKKVYRVGKAEDPSSATTEFDTTVKAITPMGGFVRYGIVKNDFIVIKVCPPSSFFLVEQLAEVLLAG